MHVYLRWYASQTFQYVFPSLPLSKEALFQEMTPSRPTEFFSFHCVQAFMSPTDFPN